MKRVREVGATKTRRGVAASVEFTTLVETDVPTDVSVEAYVFAPRVCRKQPAAPASATTATSATASKALDIPNDSWYHMLCSPLHNVIEEQRPIPLKRFDASQRRKNHNE